MDGKTEIKINGQTYGILFNILSIREAVSRFSINPLSAEMRGMIATLKVVYCGMVVHAEFNPSSQELPTIQEVLKAYANGGITDEQLIPIFKAFTESTVISETLQKANEIAGESKKKVIPKKK